MKDLWGKIENRISIINYFLPKKSINFDSGKKNEYQVSIFVIFIILITTGFYAPYCYLLNMPLMGFGCLFTPPVCLLSLFILKTWDKKAIATNLVCASTLGTILVAYYAGGLGSSPPIVWFFVFPVLAVILVGTRTAAVWSGVIMVSFISLEVWRLSVGYSFSEFTPFIQFYTNIVNVIIGSVILFLFVSHSLESKNEAIDLAHESFTEKQKILSILSHDIANILNISLIKTSSHFIEKYEKKNVLNEEMAKVHKTLQMMHELIKHVNELEGIKSGKADLSLEKVNLNEVFADVKFIFQESLKKKNLTLDIETDEHVFVNANKTSILNNVINNFVSNAIKFSPNGSTIKIKVETNEEHVSFSIIDQGIGIPANIARNLFNFNEKTSRRGTDGESGTGFGMPIAKSAIEGQGGSLEVQSEENKGTTFKVTLKKAA